MVKKKSTARPSSGRREAKKSSPDQARIEEVLCVVYRTCEAKGWHWNLVSLDRRHWRYATVSVERAIQSGFRSEAISGTFEVTVDNGVRVAPQQTSFYGHGIRELQLAVMAELERLPWLKPRPRVSPPSPVPGPLQQLNALLSSFHKVALQLTHRQRGRPPYLIHDEYDVQDLLHALLRGVLDDVRPEEVVPSYAGGASRLDFLLKTENVAIEAKMATEKLRDRELGEQLIIDIRRYQEHPHCHTLLCLVYDPERTLKNPAGLRNDLSGKHDRLDVRVVIVPS